MQSSGEPKEAPGMRASPLSSISFISMQFSAIFFFQKIGWRTPLRWLPLWEILDLPRQNEYRALGVFVVNLPLFVALIYIGI